MVQGLSLFLVFFGGITSLGIGSYVLLKDSRSLLNRLFFLMTFMVGLWGLGYGFSLISLKESFEIALFVIKFGWVGVFSVGPIFFHICLIIVKKEKIFKRKLFLSLFYFPLLFSIFYMFAYSPFFLPSLPEQQGPFMADISFFRVYFIFYFIPLMILGFLFLTKEYFETNITREKNLTKYFLLGSSIAAIGGSLAGVFPLLLGILNNFWRSAACAFFGIGMLIIGLGIIRYRIFIDFRDILDTIFKTLVDLVIVTDDKGTIGLVNRSTLTKLEYREEDLIGKNIEDIIKDGKTKWQEIFQELKQKDIISGKEIYFKTKENKTVPFLLDSSTIEVKGKTTGIINIGKEIERMVTYREQLEKEVKKRTQELEEKAEELQKSKEEIQKRADELERFYQLTVGRELRMIELKKEIKELEKELEKEQKQDNL